MVDRAGEHITARIGMVNFINTAPLYEIWKETVSRPDWLIVEAAPADLNRMLFNGELDLGFISSHEYARHPDEYRILSDLSISATGEVGSVFLFSTERLAELAGKEILLSAQSQTSVSLIRIILEDFIGVRPRFTNGWLKDHEISEFHGVLAIGDEALRLSREQYFKYTFDLGRLWHDNTGLPFVFALWAVREDFCRCYPELVAEIHQELIGCAAAGRRQLARISKRVASRIPMEPGECYRYLAGIELDLDEPKKRAVELYFRYLLGRGEGAAGALPLKIL